jgi:integrase
MSSLYKRNSDNKWVCVIELPRKPGEKKRSRKPFYADGNLTEAQAEKFFKAKKIELEYQIENNIYRNPGNSTIKDLIAEYNEHNQDIAITTKSLNKMYETVHICPVDDPNRIGIGHVKLRDCVPMVFENFYHRKMTEGKKLSPNTIIKLHSFLHGAFKFAVKNKMILINPIDSTKCPKKIKYKPRIPTDDEFMKLLTASSGTFDEVAIALAGGLSLCRGEICGLKWDDIDWVKHKIKIEETHVHFTENVRKDPKADARRRSIFVPVSIMNVLKKYHDSLENIGTYICDYKPDAYGKHFKKLVEKHGLHGITLHKLRHYNAIIMMKLGIPDKVAAGRTGHSQLSTLQEIYQHATEDTDRIASEKINEFFPLQ